MAASEVPARRLLLVAKFVVVAGLIGAFAWLIYALGDQTESVNDFRRLPSRGESFEVTEAGTYTIWAGAACGGMCDVPPLAELHELMEIAFIGPDGKVVPEEFPGSQSYRVSGARHGKAAWVVEFEQPGVYEVVRYNHGTGTSVLFVSEGVGMDSRIIAGIVRILAVTVLVAVPLFAVAWYRRRQAVAAMIERIKVGG